MDQRDLISEMRERLARAEISAETASFRINAHADRIRQLTDLLMVTEQRITSRLDKIESFWKVATSTVKYTTGLLFLALVLAGKLTADQIAALWQLFVP